jgi:hypothetical protein
MNQKRQVVVVGMLTLALVVSGLLFVTLLAPRVLAQPSAQASENQICPLSDEQADKAVEAFGKIAKVFRDEPRCVNCHGAVNPFAANTKHAGGEFDPIMKTVPNPLAGEANPAAEGGVAPDEYTTQDDEATFGQCAACHDEFPGLWQIPPDVLFFVGKDDLALCKQERFFFERKADQFLQHIERDFHPENPFIQEAFTGNMGGAAKTPVPPKGVTHDQLKKMAHEWVDAQGGKFRGSDECGCKPLHYVIDLVEKGTIDAPPPLATHIEESGKASMPLKFKEDGTYSGQATLTILRNRTITTPVGGCASKTTYTVTFPVTGEVNDEKGTLRVKFGTPTTQAATVGTCPDEGVAGPGSDSLAHNEYGPFSDGFEMPAQVGESKKFTFPISAGPIHGQTEYTVTIRQVE